ncbi:MAG TPA: Crp/Fnr family transcriptional regulator [Polyangiaceae bacterium]
MDASATLGGFRFTQRLSHAARQELDQSLMTVDVAERKTLIRRGDKVAGAYLVLEGVLRIYNIDARGREVTLYSVEPHDACIFAMNCAFNDLRYPAWVENEEAPTRLAVIPSLSYRKLHELDPAVRGFTFDVLSSRIFDLMNTIEEMATLDMEQRLASFLTRKCNEQGVVTTSHAKIAANLGTAREVVTRHLRQLESRGLIETSRGEIRIFDPVVLAARAES